MEVITKMWKYNNTLPSNELYHHGILGMKWGVRRFQDKSGRLTTSGKKRYNNKDSKDGKEPEKTTNSSKDKKTGLTDKQKKAIVIGAAAVATALAIYGGYKLSKHIKSNEVIKEKLKNINPNYTTDFASKNFLGTNMNCGQTTIAEEMVMRGEKVHARLNEAGMYPEQFGKYFKGMHGKSISTLNLGEFGDSRKITMADAINPMRGMKVKNLLQRHIKETFPDGSRGSIYLPHINSNHFISFEKVKGAVRFDNPQNMKLNLNSFFSGVITNGSPGADRYGIRITRLDDLEINKDAIKEVVTSFKDDLTSTFETNVVSGADFVMKMG